MHKRTIATTELGLRTIKQVALELNIKAFQALELIVSGDKDAGELSKKAYEKFKR